MPKSVEKGAGANVTFVAEPPNRLFASLDSAGLSNHRLFGFIKGMVSDRGEFIELTPDKSQGASVRLVCRDEKGELNENRVTADRYVKIAESLSGGPGGEAAPLVGAIAVSTKMNSPASILNALNANRERSAVVFHFEVEDPVSIICSSPVGAAIKAEYAKGQGAAH